MEITKRSYLLSNDATLNLESIILYSLNRWEEHKTKIYMDQLTESFDDIAKYPSQIGIKKIRKSTFKMYRSGKHYIIFKSIKTKILILAVLHERQNIERIISEYA